MALPDVATVLVYRLPSFTVLTSPGHDCYGPCSRASGRGPIPGAAHSARSYGEGDDGSRRECQRAFHHRLLTSGPERHSGARAESGFALRGAALELAQRLFSAARAVLSDDSKKGGPLQAQSTASTKQLFIINECAHCTGKRVTVVDWAHAEVSSEARAFIENEEELRVLLRDRVLQMSYIS
ncbi:hypothetical protein AK812_SmicGene10346 [Symbiodinium microadriaticum]|uniref:Uncharacterized protein n=1 Tax=Symbiodinium microadriaticum TaxID=2951 RepID=A0A1Q9EG80_SYMMI|nr:hypothetical protein AK812_SmicGene10346 [Symbiodinium microadriaticum]